MLGNKRTPFLFTKSVQKSSTLMLNFILGRAIDPAIGLFHSNKFLYLSKNLSKKIKFCLIIDKFLSTMDFLFFKAKVAKNSLGALLQIDVKSLNDASLSKISLSYVAIHPILNPANPKVLDITPKVTPLL